MQVPIFTDFHEKLFSGDAPSRCIPLITAHRIRRITDIFYGADYDL